MTSPPQLDPYQPPQLPAQQPEDQTQTTPKRAGWLGKALAALGAIISILYLGNIGWGVFELSPDNIPGAGNIDEALFTLLLVYCLSRLGIHLPWLARKVESRQ